MSKKERIKAWFAENRPYFVGVTILRDYGRPTERYTSPPTDYLRDMMRIDITDLARSQTAEKQAFLLNDKPKDSPFTIHHLPLPIQNLRKRRQALWDEYRRLHGQMVIAARTKTETFDRPFRILNIHKELIPINQAIKDFELNGTLPPVVVHNEAAAEVQKNMDRWRYLNERITRIRNDETKKEESDKLKAEREELRIVLGKRKNTVKK